MRNHEDREETALTTIKMWTFSELPQDNRSLKRISGKVV